jgi:hypothetical protein
LQGNISVDKLLQIKASGAGLGHIPHQQMMMLASVLGMLDTNMDLRDLEFNLRRVRRIYQNIQNDLTGRGFTQADLDENTELGIEFEGTIVPTDAGPRRQPGGAAPSGNNDDPFSNLGRR